MSVQILNGDCRGMLKTLPDASVHCCVTSPPYFGLRDYGHAGQIGLEPTPAEFVAELVAVFREVRRVLRDDGTLWLNLGDSYGKAKQLSGVPWTVAFALRDDGWYLRQDIIWHKPNPMPESVTDRCTKAHEYLFLLAKSERYHCDMSSIAEPANYPEGSGNMAGNRYIAAAADDPRMRTKAGLAEIGARDTRNKRSVWTVPTQPFTVAHFATFPPALIEPCILAGCPEGGAVLDPFGGAGTTGLVADRLQRNAILIELNPEYADMARRRITGDSPLFAEVA